jgi:glycosyltransferase involved in cell wall biosynthesis
VGTNTRSKRHHLAIRAFATTVPRPWHLVLVQSRKARQGLTHLPRRLRIDDRITWLETVAQKDLVTLIQAAGGLIQPSVYEGFGLPVLEAMACGCPVVVSDIAPLREITAGAALSFPVGDFERFCNVLGDFVRSTSLRRSLREQGLCRAKDFSWDNCARATLEVYREAATRC